MTNADERIMERIFGIELERTLTFDGRALVVRCYRNGQTALIHKATGATISTWPLGALTAYTMRTMTDAELRVEIRHLLRAPATGELR